MQRSTLISSACSINSQTGHPMVDHDHDQSGNVTLTLVLSTLISSAESVHSSVPVSKLGRKPSRKCTCILCKIMHLHNCLRPRLAKLNTIKNLVWIRLLNLARLQDYKTSKWYYSTNWFSSYFNTIKDANANIIFAKPPCTGSLLCTWRCSQQPWTTTIIYVKNLFKQVIINIVSFVETTDDDLINNHGN